MATKKKLPISKDVDKEKKDILKSFPKKYGTRRPNGLTARLCVLYKMCKLEDDFYAVKQASMKIDGRSGKKGSQLHDAVLTQIREGIRKTRQEFIKYFDVENDSKIILSEKNWEDLLTLRDRNLQYQTFMMNNEEDNVVMRFINLCRLISLKLGKDEKYVWNKLKDLYNEKNNTDKSYPAYISETSGKNVLLEISYNEGWKCSGKYLKWLEHNELPTIKKIDDSWKIIANCAGCQILYNLFDGKDDHRELSNEFVKCLQSHLPQYFGNLTIKDESTSTISPPRQSGNRDKIKKEEPDA